MKNAGKTILGKIATVAFLLIMQSVTAFAYDFMPLQAYGVDTIAGYSTLLRSSKTYPNTEIRFTVVKPDGSKVNINTFTDETGVAKLDLYDYHTRNAGRYLVSAAMVNSADQGKASSFMVFPDEVSLEESVITVNKSVVKADGEDKVFMSVNIRDQYGNPFEGHQVNLISSRAEDDINAGQGDNSITDVNGTANFSVTSPSPGVSVFSAVDTTAGTVLSKRAQIAFLSGDSMVKDAGGSLERFIPLASAADAGPLHHFEIEDLPDQIESGDTVDVRVTAKDTNGLTVEDYTGTIHFSVEGGGDGVSLPSDYTYKADDLGSHLFSLALSFTTDGTYNLEVTDVNNISVKGEKTVVVGGSSGTQTQQGGEKPEIVTPAAGSYSDNVQTVSGKATSGADVKIYDNDQEIGAVQAGSSGSFSYQTQKLADGDHKLYVVILDQNGDVKGTSETVEISIDTKAPEVDEITLDPSTDIKPGTVINVRILSEESLSDSAIIFNQEIAALVESVTEPGVYTAQITAPENAGAYPLDVVLVDELNNEAKYEGKATVNVSEDGGSVEVPVTEETVEVTQEETQVTETQNNPPTEVFGLIAYGTDKRATLVWEAASDDVNVNHYRIRFGLDPVTMDNVVDTKTAATTWYIPDLQNGKEYYFAVTAVDDEGLESATWSQTVSAIPFTLEVTGELPETPTGALAGADALHGASVENIIPPEMSKNGPEVIWLAGLTGLISGIIRKATSRRRKAALK
jgi:hypothetical protein